VLCAGRAGKPVAALISIDNLADLEDRAALAAHLADKAAGRRGISLDGLGRCARRDGRRNLVMSGTVVFRQTALRNLARVRSEDKDLFGRTRRAIALLADQPYPENAGRVGRHGRVPVALRRHPGPVRSR
jgi:hypothetical protein